MTAARISLVAACLLCALASAAPPPPPQLGPGGVAGGVSRPRRSLTALLAAEVLFLERILAAQTAAREAGSRKPRKISRPAPAPAPVIGNSLDPRPLTKLVHHRAPAPAPAAAPPVQLFQFAQPPATPAPAPAPAVSSLDPFVMLQAPDLSQNSYGEYELYQTLYVPAAPASAQLSAASHTRQEPEIVTAAPEHISARKPKKRTLRYGAFELYQL